MAAQLTSSGSGEPKGTGDQRHLLEAVFADLRSAFVESPSPSVVEDHIRRMVAAAARESAAD